MSQNRAHRRLADVWTCPGCDAHWRGQQPCHCSGCHQTFAGSAMFTAHRSRGECKTPGDVGATRLVDGIWRGPEWNPTALRESA